MLGLDTIVIAGTGAGKTMPFVMPLIQKGNCDFTTQDSTGRKCKLTIDLFFL
jgi:superfamily II DNA/RNA helicase